VSPGGAFTIVWSRSGKCDLARLPEKVATAAVEFIYSRLTTSPARAGKALSLELEGQHSAHLGDYRIMYFIDEPRRTVLIINVVHRSDAYRRR
jgi:mRNA interferase RelE/StbE